MREDRNILKRKYKSGMVEIKHKKLGKFYAVINIEVIENKNKVIKSFVKEVEGTRMQAKNELEMFAKSVNGTITYFGGFKN